MQQSVSSTSVYTKINMRNKQLLLKLDYFWKQQLESSLAQPSWIVMTWQRRRQKILEMVCVEGRCVRHAGCGAALHFTWQTFVKPCHLWKKSWASNWPTLRSGGKRRKSVVFSYRADERISGLVNKHRRSWCTAFKSFPLCKTSSIQSKAWMWLPADIYVRQQGGKTWTTEKTVNKWPRSVSS